MFLLNLCFLFCVNIFACAKCNTPVERLCVDANCNEPISQARGLVKYTADSEGKLTFTTSQDIWITSKTNKEKDYWGAIIDGKRGYVPSVLVKEIKIYHEKSTLKLVKSDSTSNQNTLVDESNLQKNETENSAEPKFREIYGNDQNNIDNSNTIEKPIKPAKTFKVIEGTTFSVDEREEITPSATVEEKPASRVVDTASQPSERATIPLELIQLNSNYEDQKLVNANNLTVESLKENDDNVSVESKDIDGEDETEGDDEEDEEEKDDGEEEEEEEYDEASEVNKNEHLEQKSQQPTKKLLKSDEVSLEESGNLEEVKTPTTETIDASVEGATADVENSVTSQVTMNVGNATTSVPMGQASDATSLPPPPRNPKIKMEIPAPEVPKIYKRSLPPELNLNALPSQSVENLETGKEIPRPIISQPKPPATVKQQSIPEMRMHHPEPGLNALPPQSVENLETGKEIPQPIISQPKPPATVKQQSIPEMKMHLPEPGLNALPSQPAKILETGKEIPQPIISQPKPPATVKQQSIPEMRMHHPEPGLNAVPPQSVENLETGKGTPQPLISDPASMEHPGTSQIKIETTATPLEMTLGSGLRQPVQQIAVDASAAAGGQNPEAVTPPVVMSEVTTDSFATTQQPFFEETSTFFSQISVSADAVAENPEKPVLTTDPIERNDPTKSFFKASTPVDVEEKVEVTTEGSVTLSGFLEEDLAKNSETTDQVSKHFEKAEEPGMMSQITDMFSGWFTSAQNEGSAKPETPFQDVAGNGKADTESEAVLGTCQDPETGSDCEGFTPSDQANVWNAWIPAGLSLEGVLTQSNTLLYLIVTAITVLLFTLGHNLIEKKGKTGPLIAKINKLEHELLVTTKECHLLREEVSAAREKINLYENSANDELVVVLQAELEESKRVRSELESSIEVLQQELDSATEAGLDLNKMLSEVLTQKGGSESLLKSVENLQAQLDSQQKTIDEMTKKLGVKNEENENLQLALEAANEKSDNLEEQLTDIKHNLNLHLKEKEDLTRDLNSQIDQLKIRTSQLGEAKEKEIETLKKRLEEVERKLSDSSSAVTVKEEEVKALKESMKQLKTKGDVKIDAVFEMSRVKAELAKEVKENHGLSERLQKEESSKLDLMERFKGLEDEMEKLKKRCEEAEQRKDEAEKKLEVLSTYFKEKETQLQKELGLQEALWAQKKGDEKSVYNMMKSLQEEMESYKSQNETLKREILEQKRGLKNHIVVLEQKAHENWVAARQAERKLEESKHEMAQLRNRLTLVEKNSSSNTDGKGSIRSSEELNGVEAASPILHDTSSPLLFPPLPLDPNNSNLLPPGFMPPPMFMPPPIGGFIPPPPFLPGDRRPPPLGRMSSPPLNNRFSPSSPADYPFEGMSSPPLSPPGSNYRSPNDDRDRYRNRTPPEESWF